MESKNKLREIVFGEERERCFIDGTTLGGIIFPIIKLYHLDVYIYGGGTDITSVVLYFINCGIEVKGILDTDKEKSGKIILGKVPIIDPYSLDVMFDPEKTLAIINTIYFTGLEQSEIVNLLFGIGIKSFYAINDSEKVQIKAQSSWADVGRIDFYREHCEELEETYQLLYDADSKATMLEYIRAYMQCGVYGLPQCDSRVKYFLGSRKRGKNHFEEIFEHFEDEVWINCGSNIGDTIFWYFANGFNAKRVYAYEGDESMYRKLCFHLRYLPEEFRNKVQTISEYVNEETDFERVIQGGGNFHKCGY